MGMAGPRWRRPRSVDDIAGLLADLWDRETGDVDPSPALRAAIVDQFHRLYYHSGEQTWKNTHYRGVTTWKCPLDLWVYQELIHDLRPDLIVETGTAYGGSALYLADLCETIGNGRVVTIDIRDRAGEVEHGRLTKLIGSSADPALREQVTNAFPTEGPVLVILDSDHSADHVRAELDLWSDLVTPGSYLIVEDTNINGHPVFPGFGPGPAEAIDVFLAGRTDFVVDRTPEKLMLTWNPGGFLRRTT
jgi:cephalosporin hydroxylase